MGDERPDWTGVLLAGAPGAGKRTVAFALGTLSRRYVRLPALTTARECALDAEQARAEEIADLRSWAQVFHESTRDGAALVYDRVRVQRIRDAGALPVATVDAAAGLDAFERESPGWLAVLLHNGAGAPRDLARAAGRFTLAVRTDRLPPVAVAQLVHRSAQAG